jgi:hypothetical protein
VALAELAGRQWGVVSAGQLRALGLGSSAVARRVQAGRLHRLHRGVYAVGHAVLRREGRFLAAVLACGPGAVLSHVSAAAHWGLLQTDQAGVDVTAPRGRHGGRGVRLHRARFLIAQDTTHHQGIPITSLARTFLDLAAKLEAARLERALAQAERLRLYDLRALHDVVSRANGHRGKRALAAAIAQEPAFTRSYLESWFLDIVRQAALPEPKPNFLLTAPDHELIEVDFYWPTHRLVVELDGWEYHRTRDAFERDRRRDAALQAIGCRVLRFTAREDPHTIQARLHALLRDV